MARMAYLCCSFAHNPGANTYKRSLFRESLYQRESASALSIHGVSHSSHHFQHIPLPSVSITESNTRPWVMLTKQSWALHSFGDESPSGWLRYFCCSESLVSRQSYARMPIDEIDECDHSHVYALNGRVRAIHGSVPISRRAQRKARFVCDFP